MAKWYIGIDNGTSGSIGITNGEQTFFYHTPVKIEQSYTKTKQNISRVEALAFKEILENIEGVKFAVLERPRVNPQQFKTSMSAMRTLEAQQITLELLGIPFIFCDSKEWQKELLPKGTKSSPELKKASLDIGSRLFPQFADMFKKQKDADGMLIAEWARRNNF